MKLTSHSELHEPLNSSNSESENTLLVENLKMLLRKGKYEELFSKLKGYFHEKQNNRLLKEVELLHTRYNGNKAKELDGTIHHEEFAVTENKINKALYGVIEQISKVNNPVDLPPVQNIKSFKLVMILSFALLATAFILIVVFNSEKSTQMLTTTVEYAELKKQVNEMHMKVMVKHAECVSLPPNLCSECYHEWDSLVRVYNSLRKNLVGFSKDYDWMWLTVRNLPDNISEIKYIKESFSDGQLRKAEHFLDIALAKIEKNDAGVKINEQIDKNILASLYILKARMLMTHYENPMRYDSARQYLDRSLANVKTAEQLNAFGDVLYAHNQSPGAVLYYESALKTAQSDSLKALIANNLGRAYALSLKYLDAENMYQLSISLYEKLAKTNPSDYQPRMATAFINLAELYREWKKMNEADSTYKLGIEAFKKAIQNTLSSTADIPAIQAGLARAYMNYGILQSDNGHTAEAIKFYLDAFSSYQNLSKTDPDKFEAELARTALNLGNIYGTDTSAEVMHLKAIDIYGRLSKQDPARFEPLLAKTQMNLGGYYLNINKSLEAKLYLEKAEKIYENLAYINPIQFELELAMVKMNLGIYYYQNEELVKSDSLYHQSYNILARLVRIIPESANPSFAKTCQQLGMLYQKMNQMGKAADYYEEARKLYEVLASEYPLKYNFELANFNSNTADFYLFTGNYAKAIILSEKALALDSSPDGLWVNCNLANGYLLQGNLNKAKKAYEIYFASEKDKRGAYLGLLKDFDRFRKAGIHIPNESEILKWLKKFS